MGDDLIGYLEGTSGHDGPLQPLASVTLGAPIPEPRKVIGVGRNYREHARELGNEAPTEPVLFAKFATSVIGPEEPILIPSAAKQVDYEAELGVVIGSRASEVSAATALEHVAGYTCLNDVSARDLQFPPVQWTRGKAIDTFCPLGPHLVTRDEIPDPQALRIRCWLNGEVMQDSSTAEMIFSVADLVSFISQTITLLPGDIIATGTPPGVGVARTPPRFLQPGDEVTVEIERIGRLTNPLRRREA